MIRIEESIDVAREPATIYELLSAVERYPEWLPGVTAAEQTSPGPVAEGTTFQLRLVGPTGPIVAEGVVVAAEAPRRLALRGQAPQGRVEGELDLESGDAGTKLTVRMQVELGGMYRFAEGLVAGELRRSMPGNLARIRERLESATPA